MKEGNLVLLYTKQPITSEQMQKMFTSGQLGEANSKDTLQLLRMRTAWFYLTLYFEKRGRENPSKLTKEMLVLQTSPQGRRYCELRRDALMSDQKPPTRIQRFNRRIQWKDL